MSKQSFTLSYIRSEMMKFGSALPSIIEIVLIGGANMIYRGLKAATKDVDIVVLNPKDLETFSRTLINLGYVELKALPIEYSKIGASIIMRSPDDFQCDIFYRQVCNALEITPRILGRTEILGSFGNLTVSLMSPEDIFLFKGITERELDLDDMRTLVEHGLRWELILDECQDQSGYRIWETFLLLKLEELEAKYGIQTPIYSELKGISELKLIQEALSSFLENGKSFSEISNYLKDRIDYSDSWLRRKISLMVENGIITRKRAGRSYLYFYTETTET